MNDNNFIYSNSYTSLPNDFYEDRKPVPVLKPKLLKLNTDLCKYLNLNEKFLEQEGASFLSGNKIARSSKPISLAYAGHQFGNFVDSLGDGRAVLLGEIKAEDGRLFDIQLKGSGKTRFSRQGDGRSPLGPVIREYILSEAIHFLGIPTTRSLSIVTTGEFVERESKLPGGILARIASSHIRIGTFEFFHFRNQKKNLKQLADYTISRHFPEIKKKKGNLYKLLLEKTISLQANLVSKWLNVGFIHGVMNTDNTTISGETIDYGPCAFMNQYNPDTVYSYIDIKGRYCYGNQAQIIFWNLTRFAESLSSIIHDDPKESQKLIISSLEKFPKMFNDSWNSLVKEKFGFSKEISGDDKIIISFLEILLKNKVDFTKAFRNLSISLENKTGKESFFSTFINKKEIKVWHNKWQNRIKEENEKEEEIVKKLKMTNPSVIPRNHIVEDIIDQVVIDENIKPLDELISMLKKPFNDYEENHKFLMPPKENEDIKNTFCGT